MPGVDHGYNIMSSATDVTRGVYELIAGHDPKDSTSLPDEVGDFAAQARAEADRIQAEADAARARRADALRDVTPRDADRL